MRKNKMIKHSESIHIVKYKYKIKKVLHFRVTMSFSQLNSNFNIKNVNYTISQIKMNLMNYNLIRQNKKKCITISESHDVLTITLGFSIRFVLNRCSV